MLLRTTIVTRFFDEIEIFISLDAFFHDPHDVAIVFKICKIYQKLFQTIVFNFELICSLQILYLFAIVVNA